MSSAADTLNTALAAEVRAARTAANLSQVEAAALLNVSVRAYQAWEAGDALPQPRHRRRLAEFCREAQEAA